MTDKVLKGKRVDFHVKIDPEVKKVFYDLVRKFGTSECELLESWVCGVGSVVGDGSCVVKKSPGIGFVVNVFYNQLNLNRVVKKARRGLVEGVVHPNFYDGVVGEWRVLPVSEAADLNSNFHIVGCQCLKCRKR